MSDERLIATVRKNTREEIRVSLTDFNGYDLLNVRVWFDDGSGTMRPGKSGIAFRVETLPGVVEALGQAVEEAKARGLLR